MEGFFYTKTPQFSYPHQYHSVKLWSFSALCKGVGKWQTFSSIIWRNSSVGLRANVLESLPLKTRTHCLESGLAYALQEMHSMNTQEELEKFSW